MSKNKGGFKMDFKLRKFSIVMLFALLILFLSGCAQEKIEGLTKTDTSIPVRIVHTRILPDILLFIALEKGYFEEEGLNVELKEVTSGNLKSDLVISGDADFATSLPTMTGLSLLMNSPDIYKILHRAGLAYHTEDKCLISVVAKTDSGIDNMQSLKGKKVSCLAAQLTLVNAVMKKLDLDKDVEIVPATPAVIMQMLETDQIDASFMIEPLLTSAKMKGLDLKQVDRCLVEKHIVSPYIADLFIVSPDFAEKYPGEVNKVSNAFNKANRFMVGNQEESKKIFAKYVSIPEETALNMPHLRYVSDPDMSLGELNRALQNTADVLYEEGLIDGKVDVSGAFFLDNF